MKVFVDHNIKVIYIKDNYAIEVEGMIKSSNTSFKEEDKNDYRDAVILSMAISILDPAESVILCEDKKLIAEFERHGFEVRTDSKNFVRELFGNFTVPNIATPDITAITPEEQHAAVSPHLRSLLEKSDPDYATLLESELRNLPQRQDNLSSRFSDMRKT